jgi:hypothetical protein
MSRARNNASGAMPGNVIQFNNIRVDAQYGYTASSTTGSGTAMTPFDMTITPKYANSKIMVQWEIHYEAQYGAVFVIWKNGSLSSNGYNTSSGNTNWSSYAATAYDGDVASTPNRITITYVDTPGTTSPVTYGLAVRSAGAGNQVIYINRPFSSTGANDYEVGVSMGYIQEIAQ